MEAKVFIQDPFNPVVFTEDSVRYVDVSNIVCALTCYDYREDLVELAEGDLILLLDALQDTNEVIRVAEAAEMTEKSVDEVNPEPQRQTRAPRRRKRRFEENFIYYE